MIRIRINKDRKVVSHLESDHQNNNLLFYDFNNFTNQNVANEVSRVQSKESKRET